MFSNDEISRFGWLAFIQRTCGAGNIQIKPDIPAGLFRNTRLFFRTGPADQTRQKHIGPGITLNHLDHVDAETVANSRGLIR